MANPLYIIISVYIGCKTNTGNSLLFTHNVPTQRGTPRRLICTWTFHYCWAQNIGKEVEYAMQLLSRHGTAYYPSGQSLSHTPGKRGECKNAFNGCVGLENMCFRVHYTKKKPQITQITSFLIRQSRQQSPRFHARGLATLGEWRMLSEQLPSPLAMRQLWPIVSFTS